MVLARTGPRVFNRLVRRMGVSKSKKADDRAPLPRIFIVDDEPMLLELAEKILGDAKYDIQTFNNPEKALSAYSSAEKPPELVITDFAMHQMDGLDLIRECRRLHPKQKMILVSGTVDEIVFSGTGVRPDGFLAIASAAPLWNWPKSFKPSWKTDLIVSRSVCKPLAFRIGSTPYEKDTCSTLYRFGFADGDRRTGNPFLP